MSDRKKAGDLLAELKRGCGDNSCSFAMRKGGMGTNGGCRCGEKVEDALAAARADERRKVLEQAAMACSDVAPVDMSGYYGGCDVVATRAEFASAIRALATKDGAK